MTARNWLLLIAGIQIGEMIWAGQRMYRCWDNSPLPPKQRIWAGIAVMGVLLITVTVPLTAAFLMGE